MMCFGKRIRPTAFAMAALWLLTGQLCFANDQSRPRRLLYVAEPGIRNDLRYGGHGVLVFDVDDGHRFVRRIKTSGFDANGQPLNVKGVCANAATRRLYVTTTQQLMCLDLVTDKLLWERAYEGGCDRMSISPDGKTIYVPSLEGPHWNVVDGLSGEVVTKLVAKSGAHNTVYARDGRHVYLAGLASPLLRVADTTTHSIVSAVGPFSASIRPFTVDGRGKHCYVNINELLGFEMGDLETGKMLCRVEVAGFSTGPTKRHGCPSHGIGLTPDEKEIWLTDASNRRVHIFDATTFPPKQVTDIELRDEPGWITFSLDGDFAYPSTGDVIDTHSRRIVTGLKDEEGREVQSEKLLEIDFDGQRPLRVGDQFGVGRVTAP